MKKIEKYLLWGILGGVFLLLFMPFVIANSLYFPFVAGKGFYFRIIVEIMAMLYVALAAIHRKWWPQKNVLYWVLGALLLFLFISNILSPNSYKSFFSNFERMEGYINIVHLVIFFVVTHSVIKSKKMWNSIFATSLVVSVLVTGYVLLQLGGAIEINQGGARVDGPFGNAAYLAMYVLIHAFLAGYFIAKKHLASSIRILFGIVFLGNIFVLYHTQTRGAILGFIGGLIIAGLYLAISKRKEKRIQKIVIGSLIAIMAFIGLFVLAKDTRFVRENPTLKRFANISLQEATTQSRFVIWGIALEGLKEKPLLGWGQESFNYVFNTYYDPVLYKQEQWFDRTHNLVLDWLIAGGILGGGAYLSLFVLALYFIWKREDFNEYEKAALIGLVLAYFFQNLFVFDNPTSYMMFFLLLAFLAGYKKQDENSIPAFPDSEKSMRQAAAIVLVFFMIIGAYVYSVKPLRAGGKLIDGLHAYASFNGYNVLLQSFAHDPAAARIVRGQISDMLANDGVSDPAKELLSRLRAGNPHDSLVNVISEKMIEEAKAVQGNLEGVIDMKTFATNEVREQIAALSQQLLRNQQFPLNERGAFGLFTNEQLTLHTQAAPKDSRFLLLAGSTFRILGDLPKAITYLEEAHKYSPQKQTILLELGTAYLQKSEWQKAVDVWKQAYELDERFEEAKLAYAGGLVGVGRIEEGQRLLDEIKLNKGGENLVYESAALVHIFSEAKYYEGLEDIWLWRIKRSPKNINNRIALSAVYYELGQNARSISVIEEAILIDPNFKTVGDQYIEDIKAGRRPQ